MGSGIFSRKSASMLAFIAGMHTQPSSAPRHQMSGVRPSASSRFSVLMAKSSESWMTRTRLRGAPRSEVNTPPSSVATPVQALTQPRAVSPPPGREIAIAGSAALYMEAMRLMAERKRIRCRTPFSRRRKRSPARAACRGVSALPCARRAGMRTKPASATTATKQVPRSKKMTISSPAKA